MEERLRGCNAAGRRGAGGIISLAKIIADHREAIEYDLLTRTGYQLSDIGSSLGWPAVRAFINHEPVDSAFVRELHPEFSTWATTAKTNAILADIFDILANINSNLVALGSGKPAKKPKPYPRPVKKEPENVKHFGRDPLPPDELRRWFEEKRKNAGSSISDTGSDSGPVRSAAVIN